MTIALVFPLALPAPGALAAEREFDVSIAQRKVTEPGSSIRVVAGDTVTLHWHTDELAELHLHGYDIALEVKPGEPATMRFEATVAGRFPVTSHGFGGAGGHGHDALLYIEVYPH